MTYVDRTLNCVDCGVEFIHSAADQEYYQQKGFTQRPQALHQLPRQPSRDAATAATDVRDIGGPRGYERGDDRPTREYFAVDLLVLRQPGAGPVQAADGSARLLLRLLPDGPARLTAAAAPVDRRCPRTCRGHSSACRLSTVRPESRRRSTGAVVRHVRPGAVGDGHRRSFCESSSAGTGATGRVPYASCGSSPCSWRSSRSCDGVRRAVLLLGAQRLSDRKSVWFPPVDRDHATLLVDDGAGPTAGTSRRGGTARGGGRARPSPAAAAVDLPRAVAADDGRLLVDAEHHRRRAAPGARRARTAARARRRSAARPRRRPRARGPPPAQRERHGIRTRAGTGSRASGRRAPSPRPSSRPGRAPRSCAARIAPDRPALPSQHARSGSRACRPTGR